MIILDYPSRLNVIKRVLRRGKQECQESEEIMMLEAEVGGISSGVRACRSLQAGKGKEMDFSLEPLEGKQSYQHLEFSPGRYILDF